MFKRKVKIENEGILRLKLRTKILDHIGDKTLNTGQLQELENDIFELFGVKT